MHRFDLIPSSHTNPAFLYEKSVDFNPWVTGLFRNVVSAKQSFSPTPAVFGEF